MTIEWREINEHRLLFWVFEGVNKVQDMEAVKPLLLQHLENLPQKSVTIVCDMTKLTGSEFSIKSLSLVKPIFQHPSLAHVIIMGLPNNPALKFLVSVSTQLFTSNLAVMQYADEAELKQKLDDFLGKKR